MKKDNKSADFLNGSVKYDLSNIKEDPPDVPSKAYRRWVTWRYIKLSGSFSK